MMAGMSICLWGGSVMPGEEGHLVTLSILDGHSLAKALSFLICSLYAKC